MTNYRNPSFERSEPYGPALDLSGWTPRKVPWVLAVRESDLIEDEHSGYGKLLREVCDEMYRLCAEEGKKRGSASLQGKQS